MDAETFIRKQILAILREDKTGSKGKSKGSSTPAPSTGKRMGKTAQKGKESVALKNISAKAVNSPDAVFSELKISKSAITGETNQEKAKKVISTALNHPSMFAAFEGDVKVLGSDAEGWTVLVKVLLAKVEEESKDRPMIPTGRAARYLGALMTAASKLGVVKFNPDDPQSTKHDPGTQNVYINLPM